MGLHEKPRGVTDIEFVRSREEMVFDFDSLREAVLSEPIRGQEVSTIIVDDLITSVTQHQKEKMLKFFEHYGASREVKERILGLDTGKTTMEQRPVRYGLHELWPYRHFVRPIVELATPHLANIIEYFNDPQRFYTNSKGRKRTIEETNQLFERVAVVKRVYNQRMQDEERVEKIRVESVKRRINDHKIKIQGLRTRHSQMFNEPDTQDYQAELTALHTLLVDIQLAFNLT